MLSTTVGFSWIAKRIPSTNLIFPFKPQPQEPWVRILQTSVDLAFKNNPTPSSMTEVPWCQGVPPIWPVRRSTCLALLVGSANKGHSAGHLASKLKDASGHTIQNLFFWVECQLVLNETQTKRWFMKVPWKERWTCATFVRRGSTSSRLQEN